MSDRIPRRGARVLVLDEQERVLLLRGFDPQSDRPAWWFTPGGGVAEGESDYDGAVRELYEETGLSAPQLEGPVWSRTADFDFMGESYRQNEVFYFVRVPNFEPVAAAWTDEEVESMLGHRWWTIDELEQTSDRYYPLTLASELRQLLADGIPATAKELGYEGPNAG